MRLNSHYSSNMKWVSIILLVVLTFTVLAPMTLFSFLVADDGRSVLTNLDVCHSAAPALSSNGEMPCVSAYPFSFAPAVSIWTKEPAYPLFTELILTTRSERPPQV